MSKCPFEKDGGCTAMLCYSSEECGARDENGGPKYCVGIQKEKKMKSKKIIFTIAFMFAASVAAATPAQITLQWERNPEPDMSHYNIYRSQSPAGLFILLNPTTHTIPVLFYADGSTSLTIQVQATASPTTLGLAVEPVYTDGDCESGTVYFYYVTAVDLSGNESGPSEVQGKLANNGQAPAPPTRVQFVINIFSIVFNQ